MNRGFAINTCLAVSSLGLLVILLSEGKGKIRCIGLRIKLSGC